MGLWHGGSRSRHRSDAEAIGDAGSPSPVESPLKRRLSLDLFRIWRAVQKKIHNLSYLFWECTLRCNLNCRHCGSDCHVSSATPDMPLGDFLTVLDGIRDAVVPNRTTVMLTGGEPLLRPDLERCGREFHDRGYPWGMVTNGFGMTEEKLHRLMDTGLGSMTISLDGLETSHNWLRGNGKSYARAVAAVGLAAKTEELAFDVVTCVHQGNFDELDRLKEILVFLGVRQWRLFTIFAKGRAENEELLDVTNDQFRGLMEFIKMTRQEGVIKASYGCEGFLGSYEKEVRDDFFYCQAGITVGSVLADGGISSCPSLRGDYVQGNIYKDNFLDVWNNRFQVMRDRSWTRTGECEQCQSYSWCEGNGLHLRDQSTGRLLRCHLNMLTEKECP